MNVLARAAANRIIQYYGITKPDEIKLYDIAADRNIVIEEKIIHGSEGRIVKNKNGGIIAVNSNIHESTKKHFVIAHELGHFELHKDVMNFICDDSDFLDWHNNNSREYEANTFAAELMMPQNIFLEFCKGHKLSINLIKELASIFQSSLTATAFRFAEVGSVPCTLVYSENSKVKWYVRNKEFPLNYISINSSLSSNTYAYDFFKTGSVPDNPETVRADAWFSNDHNCYQYSLVYEHCHKMPRYNAVLSLIWLP